jgi:hypothetical protein
MKKTLGLTLSAGAQDPAASQAGQASPASQAGGMEKSSSSSEVKGTISQDGKTLVGDDGKSWTIANPDAVKGHEGHHVSLKGSTDAATSQIQVSSVKMMKEKGSKKDASQPQ